MDPNIVIGEAGGAKKWLTPEDYQKHFIKQFVGSVVGKFMWELKHFDNKLVESDNP